MQPTISRQEFKGSSLWDRWNVWNDWNGYSLNSDLNGAPRFEPFDGTPGRHLNVLNELRPLFY